MRLSSQGVAKRLFEARRARDLTMDQLAAKAKVSQSAISRLELGKSYPATNTLEKLAIALEVDPCWLAYGTGEAPDWLTAKEERT